MLIYVSFRKVSLMLGRVASLPLCNKFDSIIFFLFKCRVQMLKITRTYPVLGLD